MLITLKNKEFIIIEDFIFKCAIGKNGIKLRKEEGDKATPSGTFSLGKLYYRADRVEKPITKISTRIIKKNMGWCDDPKNKYYNKEIVVNKRIHHEKLFRKDNLYDYICRSFIILTSVIIFVIFYHMNYENNRILYNILHLKIVDCT